MGGFRFLESTEICSPLTGCSAYLDLPENFHYIGVVRINKTHIFILPNKVGEAWIFNQKDETFQKLPDMLEHRMDGMVGFTKKNEIVVAGGTDSKTSEIFNLDTMKWRMGPDFPVITDLYGARAVQYQDSFLIVSGYDRGGRGTYLTSILKFDHVNYEWIALPSKLQKGRSLFAAFLIPDDYISCS